VSQIVVETLESLKMEFPNPTLDIKEVRKKYHKAEEEAAQNGKMGRTSGKRGES
jgi:hypothetical protein